MPWKILSHCEYKFITLPPSPSLLHPSFLANTSSMLSSSLSASLSSHHLSTDFLLQSFAPPLLHPPLLHPPLSSHREADRNNFHCDCGVAWMQDYEPLHSALSRPVTCQSPDHLMGSRIDALTMQDMNCGVCVSVCLCVKE